MAKASKWIEAAVNEPTCDVAKRALWSRLGPLQYYLNLAANKPQDQIEYLHQMRTWSRRARAATQVFEDFLPGGRTKWLNKQFRRMRRVSNDARDDDVFAERLEADAELPAASHVLERVRAHREAVQPALNEVHRRLTDKRRLERRSNQLLKRVRWRGEGEAPRFGAFAKQRLRVEVVEFFTAAEADLTTPELLHQFRICGKKLRYAMELLGGGFPECLRTEAYSLVSQLQERLGELNDLASAQTRLARWLEGSTDPQDISYLETMLADAKQSEAFCRGAFFSWWNRERQQQLRNQFGCILGDLCPQPGCP